VNSAREEALGTSTSAWFASEQEIEVGDTIVVPLDADRMRPPTFWSRATQTVYHLVLSVAAFDGT
jgi:hypothetical protein